MISCQCQLRELRLGMINAHSFGGGGKALKMRDCKLWLQTKEYLQITETGSLLLKSWALDALQNNAVNGGRITWHQECVAILGLQRRMTACSSFKLAQAAIGPASLNCSQADLIPLSRTGSTRANFLLAGTAHFALSPGIKNPNKKNAQRLNATSNLPALYWH